MRAMALRGGAALAAFAFLSLAKPALHEEYRRLGLEPAPAAADEGSRTGAAEAWVALRSAGLSFVRPLALDVLWLRILAAEAKGRFFEAATLARAALLLEPRLPRVWAYQAWNLSYNIALVLPPEARTRWVFEGLRLLREDALRYNPDSAYLRLELAFFFLHKIAGDADDAHYLYKEELARTFDPPPDTDDPDAHLARVLAGWGIDTARWRSLEERYLRSGEGEGRAGRLDPRSAAAHALYWVEDALALPTAEAHRLAGRLDAYRLGALQYLLAGGRVLRGWNGRYVFLPEPRVAAVLERELRDRLVSARASQEDPELEIQTAAWRNYIRTRVVHLYLEGRPEAARTFFASHAADLDEGERAAGPEGIVLQAFAPEVEDGRLRENREALLSRYAGLLAGSVLLRLHGEERLAAGLEGIAGVLARRIGAGTGVAIPPPERTARAVAERLYARLVRLPEAKPLIERLERWFGKVAEGPVAREVAEAVESALGNPLPFRLDVLLPPEEVSDGD